jgi:hypothetical protein
MRRLPLLQRLQAQRQALQGALELQAATCLQGCDLLASQQQNVVYVNQRVDTRGNDHGGRSSSLCATVVVAAVTRQVCV